MGNVFDYIFLNFVIGYNNDLVIECMNCGID